MATHPFGLEDTALARLLHHHGLVPLVELQSCLSEVRRDRPDSAGLAEVLRQRGLLSQAQIDATLSGALPARPAEDPPQRLGPYRLIRELARGGMGAVHEALHEPSGVTYALKTLHLGSTLTDEERRRFAAEAQLMARLDHPHVCRIHAADLAANPPYLVQDLLSGGSLQERLGRAGPLPPAEAAALTAKLARGLAHAHGLGVLHRDLKPSNVLFDERGEPRLVDFGLARELESQGRLTATGDILGTPTYLAPEQAMGLKQDDVRTDVYGLGGILYACLTGEPPIAAGSSLLATLGRVVNGEVTPPRQRRPEVPPELEAVCLRALATEADARFPDAGALADALEADDPGARAGPQRRAPALLGLLGAAAVLGALAVAHATRPRATGLADPPSPAPAPTTPPAPALAPSATPPPPTPGPQDRFLTALCDRLGARTVAFTRLSKWLGARPDDVRRLRREVRVGLTLVALAHLDLRARNLAGWQVSGVRDFSLHSGNPPPPTPSFNNRQGQELVDGLKVWDALNDGREPLPESLADSLIGLAVFDPFRSAGDLRLFRAISARIAPTSPTHQELAALAYQAEELVPRLVEPTLLRAQRALPPGPALRRLIRLRCLIQTLRPPEEWGDWVLDLPRRYTRSHPAPERAEAHTVLARGALIRRRLGRARHHLRAAREAAPDGPATPRLWLVWSEVHLALGEREEARACAATYLDEARKRLSTRVARQDRLTYEPAFAALWAASDAQHHEQLRLKGRRWLHQLSGTWRLRIAWAWLRHAPRTGVPRAVLEGLIRYRKEASARRGMPAARRARIVARLRRDQQLLELLESDRPRRTLKPLRRAAELGAGAWPRLLDSSHERAVDPRSPRRR